MTGASQKRPLRNARTGLAARVMKSLVISGRINPGKLLPVQHTSQLLTIACQGISSGFWISSRLARYTDLRSFSDGAVRSLRFSASGPSFCGRVGPRHSRLGPILVKFAGRTNRIDKMADVQTAMLVLETLLLQFGLPVPVAPSSRKSSASYIGTESETAARLKTACSGWHRCAATRLLQTR